MGKNRRCAQQITELFSCISPFPGEGDCIQDCQSYVSRIKSENDTPLARVPRYSTNSIVRKISLNLTSSVSCWTSLISITLTSSYTKLFMILLNYHTPSCTTFHLTHFTLSHNRDFSQVVSSTWKRFHIVACIHHLKSPFTMAFSKFSPPLTPLPTSLTDLGISLVHDHSTLCVQVSLAFFMLHYNI